MMTVMICYRNRNAKKLLRVSSYIKETMFWSSGIIYTVATISNQTVSSPANIYDRTIYTRSQQ